MRDFMSVEYVIRLESPRQPDVLRLLSALGEAMVTARNRLSVTR